MFTSSKKDFLDIAMAMERKYSMPIRPREMMIVDPGNVVTVFINTNIPGFQSVAVGVRYEVGYGWPGEAPGRVLTFRVTS